MRHQGNWLARLLAHTTRIEALEKEKDAMLHVDHPRNNTELRMFIGCINYTSSLGSESLTLNSE